MFWLLLLAVSHTFQNLMYYDQNLHLQVYLKDALNLRLGPIFKYPS